MTDALELSGIKIPLGPHLSPEIVRNLRDGTYERPEARAIRERLESHDTVLEIGGGIGYTSALCARRVGASRVHVYEADPRLEAPIRELYRLNGVGADLHMCGLGPRAETRELNVTVDFWESSFLCPVAPVSGTVSVQVRAFDAEIARFEPRPNFLIVDIEGGEYDLFRGVSLDGLDRIVCEIHPGLLGRRRLRGVRRALVRQGFAIAREMSTSRVWYLDRPAHRRTPRAAFTRRAGRTSARARR
ncbi:MAG TPA: FkbM family methyltransferase [Thermoleophilaceae bacterium]|nr:FkbM family methyltransferase [Thermoleophilaceae bacterium]